MTRCAASVLSAFALAWLCWASPLNAQNIRIDIDKSAAIRSNAAALFNSPHQVTLGNRTGDVTFVEFFDYNCGYCKRALDDKLALLKSDTSLRLVLKELPVLGRGSLEAAQVAVAVRMQDAGGEKYLAFHEKLMRNRGQANLVAAIAAARDVGLDVARIERDLESSEVKETLDEGRRLAKAIGIRGTPSYVVGERLLEGAVGFATLSDAIKAARK
jgi:protein-disulfide isomerase